MDAKRVKEDLRSVRKLTHYIDAVITAKARLEKRKEYLLKLNDNEAKKVLASVESELSQLDAKASIEKASEIEQRYIAIIDKLPFIDRTIIVQAFFNGVPYWKIANEIGYSEIGIQKRIGKIVEAIGKMM